MTNGGPRSDPETRIHTVRHSRDGRTRRYVEWEDLRTADGVEKSFV